ncbi:AAA family ATPase, partial [Candidatus Sumerlaeota bacterium]
MSRHLQGLESWFSRKCPQWVQDAARRLLERADVTDEDIKDLVVLCKKEAGIHVDQMEGVGFRAIPTGALGRTDNEANLVLNSISDLKGINALAPKKPLEFDPQLTIIYGPNGSGKSGYVRLLKHACGAKEMGKLLTNVRSGELTNRSCRFSCTVEDAPQTIDWQASDQRVDDLSAIEIYDDVCGEFYVGKESQVAYEPPVLALFERLVKVCDKVRISLAAEADSYTSAMPSITQVLATTPSAEWLKKLAHTTSQDDVIQHCRWNDSDKSKHEEILKRLAVSDPAHEASKLKRTKQHLDDLKSEAEALLEKLSAQAVRRYRAAKNDAVAKRKAASNDAKKVFAAAPLEGVGTDSWKLLWKHARDFSENVAYTGIKFPNTTDEARCVLCQQTLDDEAKRRFVSFEEYVTSGLEREATIAENAVKTLEDTGDIPEAKSLGLRLDSCGVTDSGERNDIIELFGALQKRKETVFKCGAEEDIPDLPSLDPIRLLTNKSTFVGRQMAGFLEDAKSLNRGDLESRDREFRAQKWLFEQQDHVRREIERFKYLEYLKRAKGTADTGDLSRMKSKIAEELITEGYLRRFETEKKNLGCDHLAVELFKRRTSKGRALHVIRLKDARQDASARDVLSEGEFRVISLAAFFADVTGRRGRAPIVLDDPVSSLDERYAGKVADRIVELSKTRQVIVFTHRLRLVVQIKEKADQSASGWQVHGMKSPGEPTEEELDKRKPLKAVRDLLNEALPRMEKARDNEHELTADGLCTKIRKIVERAIEFNFLNNVVGRYRQNIMTKGKLQELAKIQIDDCKFLENMMSRYSYDMHSQPDEAP